MLNNSTTLVATSLPNSVCTFLSQIVFIYVADCYFISVVAAVFDVRAL